MLKITILANATALPPCKEIRYTTRHSTLKYPSDYGFRQMQQYYNLMHTKEYLENNWLHVNVFYKRMEYLSIEQKKEITLE